MSENEVKNAFDRIEPEDGTQERMYANILKKAAAQKAAAPERIPIAEKMRPNTVPSPPAARCRCGSGCSAMAACLALVTASRSAFCIRFCRGQRETSRRFWSAHRSRMCRARRI